MARSTVATLGRLVGGRKGCVHCGRETVGLVGEFGPLRIPGIGDPGQHIEEGGKPVDSLLGEVGAGEEGAAVGGEEHRHRPAAPARHGLHGIHVDAVDVGPLLPIDLHIDEVFVHVGRRFRVLERLVRHHVTPVTGRVADREEDRAIGRAGNGEGGIAPFVPVDGVVLVLEKVRRGAGGEAVGHGGTVGMAASLLQATASKEGPGPQAPVAMAASHVGPGRPGSGGDVVGHRAADRVGVGEVSADRHLRSRPSGSAISWRSRTREGRLDDDTQASAQCVVSVRSQRRSITNGRRLDAVPGRRTSDGLLGWL